jgi:hypothetical protein
MIRTLYGLLVTIHVAVIIISLSTTQSVAGLTEDIEAYNQAVTARPKGHEWAEQTGGTAPAFKCMWCGESKVAPQPNEPTLDEECSQNPTPRILGKALKANEKLKPAPKQLMFFDIVTDKKRLQQWPEAYPQLLQKAQRIDGLMSEKRIATQLVGDAA